MSDHEPRENRYLGKNIDRTTHPHPYFVGRKSGVHGDYVIVSSVLAQQDYVNPGDIFEDFLIQDPRWMDLGGRGMRDGELILRSPNTEASVNYAVLEGGILSSYFLRPEDDGYVVVNSMRESLNKQRHHALHLPEGMKILAVLETDAMDTGARVGIDEASQKLLEQSRIAITAYESAQSKRVAAHALRWFPIGRSL